MDIDEKILARFDELLEMGQSVLATKKAPPAQTIGFDASVGSQLAHQWATSVQNLLARVFGHESEHYKNFSEQLGKALTYSPANRAQGVLLAAKDDFEHDQLFDMRTLIEAEVFDDFLDQAKALKTASYFAPAAVIAGAVLEDGLRKLITKNGLTLAPKPKLDVMNADLARAGVYSKLTQKKITALADIRNNAAHGHWNEFSDKDVTDLIDWTERFMESHFT